MNRAKELELPCQGREGRTESQGGVLGDELIL